MYCKRSELLSCFAQLSQPRTKPRMFPTIPMRLTSTAMTSIDQDPRKIILCFRGPISSIFHHLMPTSAGNMKPSESPVVAPVNWNAIHIFGMNADPRYTSVSIKAVIQMNRRVLSRAVGKKNDKTVWRSEKCMTGNTSMRWTTYPTRISPFKTELYRIPKFLSKLVRTSEAVESPNRRYPDIAVIA